MINYVSWKCLKAGLAGAGNLASDPLKSFPFRNLYKYPAQLLCQGVFEIRLSDSIYSYMQEHRQVPLSAIEEEFKTDKEELSKAIIGLIHDNRIRLKNKRIPIVNVKGKARDSAQKRLDIFLGKKTRPASIKLKSALYHKIRENICPKKEDKIVKAKKGYDDEIALLKQEIENLKLLRGYDSLVKEVISINKGQHETRRQKEEPLSRDDMPFASRDTRFSEDPHVERQVKKLLKDIGFA